MIAINKSIIPYLDELLKIKSWDNAEDFYNSFDISSLNRFKRKVVKAFAFRTYRLAVYNKLFIESKYYYALHNEFDNVIYAVNKFSKDFLILSFKDFVVDSYVSGDYYVKE